MSRKVLAGNWKMNTRLEEGQSLASKIAEINSFEFPVLLFPPTTHLQSVHQEIKAVDNLYLGAQNAYFEDKGAYTGEVSVPMIKDCGSEYLLIGHSERRSHFNEDNSLLLKKVQQALKHQLNVIFCFGEPLEIREAQTYKSYVKDQLEQVVFKLEEKDSSQLILAYEPIWAIGTGKNATAEQAQEVHAFVRGLIADRYHKSLAEHTSILYGGSCKPANAESIFAQEDVDGGLIGGASLKSEDFLQLYKQLKSS